ncbi:MAG: hypothetical protein H6577_16130 [Lewinellaceae bacterium]|nr:hypothetical protein [Saprospiraceae bacterium]MCB9339657.1 hypothetical protein [Lewinellaceae bacterium]
MKVSLNTRFCERLSIMLSIIFVGKQWASAQCDQLYNWAVWDDFLGNSATGYISSGGQDIYVTMSSNFDFGASLDIFNYHAFDGFNEPIPNATVPETTWSYGSGGTTTMCFSQTVSNPVLLLASIGRAGVPVTLQFDKKYNIAYYGYQVSYINDTTIIGEEGYTILLFPGDFDCVTALLHESCLDCAG